MPKIKSAIPWGEALAHAVRDPSELLKILKLDGDAGRLAAAHRAATLFSLRVPRGYIARMRPGDPQDPLLRQVLPLDAEFKSPPDFVADPVGDLQAMVSPGLLQKYAGRALLVVTEACAVHCRYCFRREFPYDAANPKKDRWAAAMDFIARDTSLHELILSGGDPLTLTNEALDDLLERVGKIRHIKRLRIHSRLPVVLPERIDDGLLKVLGSAGKRIVHVIHANHAQEIDDSVRTAIAKLRNLGEIVLNQAVLLKGVNDTLAAQIELAEALVEAGVVPYYLHMLDPVKGAHHFEVNEEYAVRLATELQHNLPGYMVPRLVREIPGRPSKTLLPIQPRHHREH
ncbi:MAG TPA: EF-P beta-lysylation protein EpmB [Gammaproteobacteria bacterium]